MTQPAEPTELDRLADLHRHRILDTAPEEAFDRVARLAAWHFHVPIALVNFVDGQRQWTKASHGLDLTVVDRRSSFCAHVVDGPGGTLIVPDALLDRRFRDSPLVVEEPHVRFYAGAPVTSASGNLLGALCVLDRVPREFVSSDVEFLEQCAQLISAELERRTLAWGEAELRASFERCEHALMVFDRDHRVQFAKEAARRLYGTGDGVIGRPGSALFTSRWPSQADEAPARNALLGGRSWTGDVMHVLHDGRELRVEAHLSPALDALGQRPAR